MCCLKRRGRYESSMSQQCNCPEDGVVDSLSQHQVEVPCPEVPWTSVRIDRSYHPRSPIAIGPMIAIINDVSSYMPI